MRSSNLTKFDSQPAVYLSITREGAAPRGPDGCDVSSQRRPHRRSTGARLAHLPAQETRQRVVDSPSPTKSIHASELLQTLGRGFHHMVGRPAQHSSVQCVRSSFVETTFDTPTSIVDRLDGIFPSFSIVFLGIRNFGVARSLHMDCRTDDGARILNELNKQTNPVRPGIVPAISTSVERR